MQAAPAASHRSADALSRPGAQAQELQTFQTRGHTGVPSDLIVADTTMFSSGSLVMTAYRHQSLLLQERATGSTYRRLRPWESDPVACRGCSLFQVSSSC